MVVDGAEGGWVECAGCAGAVPVPVVVDGAEGGWVEYAGCAGDVMPGRPCPPPSTHYWGHLGISEVHSKKKYCREISDLPVFS